MTHLNADNGLSHAALTYRAMGLSVIPCDPTTKKPLIPRWRPSQTSLPSPEQVRAWWTQWPDAAIGIITGELSDLLVADVDDPNPAAIDEVEKQFGATWWTVSTPSGGAHLGYRPGSQRVRNATRIKCFDFPVDIRGDGGYVIIPPSPGYRWQTSSFGRSLPLFPGLPSRSGADRGAAGPVDEEHGSVPIPEGTRNCTLTSLAGTMRRRAISWEAIEAALLVDNRRRCVPPLADSEVRQIARSVARYEPEKGAFCASFAFRAPQLGSPLWPVPLRRVAYSGLAGEFVDLVLPQTEADPAGLLFQFLAFFGNAIGAGPHFMAEEDRHALKLFVGIVGETAKGRKGVSLGHVRRRFDTVAPEWTAEGIVSGLSSGEGLVWAVRDPDEEITPETGGTPAERRLLVIETEFASTLKVMAREGNTLSPILRQAWDSDDLRIMTKNNPATATGAHVSIITHVTVEELRRYLKQTEMANGFANRFLWLCVRRSKALPEGGRIHEVDFSAFHERLRAAIASARETGELCRDDEARALWFDVYEGLSAGQPGLLGAVTSRAEAQVMRVACLYALAGCSRTVRRQDLEAALEVWRYSCDSAQYIFGDSLGEQTADRILGALRGNAEGLTRTQIGELFSRHESKREIDAALGRLEELGLATCRSEETGGRRASRWLAASEGGAKSELCEKRSGAPRQETSSGPQAGPDPKEGGHDG